MSEKLNPEALRALYDALKEIYDATEGYADGAPDASDHDLLALLVSSRAQTALAAAKTFPSQSSEKPGNTSPTEGISGAPGEPLPPSVEGGAGIFCEWRVYPNGYASPSWHLCNAIGFEDPNRDVVKFCNGCGKPIKWRDGE